MDKENAPRSTKEVYRIDDDTFYFKMVDNWERLAEQARVYLSKRQSWKSRICAARAMTRRGSLPKQLPREFSARRAHISRTTKRKHATSGVAPSHAVYLVYLERKIQLVALFKCTLNARRADVYYLTDAIICHATWTIEKHRRRCNETVNIVQHLHSISINLYAHVIR